MWMGLGLRATLELTQVSLLVKTSPQGICLATEFALAHYRVCGPACLRAGTSPKLVRNVLIQVCHELKLSSVMWF